jgi:hypothetical protein
MTDRIYPGGWVATVTPNTTAPYQGGGRRRAGSVHVCAHRLGQVINLDVMPDQLDALDLEDYWAKVTAGRRQLHQLYRQDRP